MHFSKLFCVGFVRFALVVFALSHPLRFCIHSGTTGTFPLGNYFQRPIADEQESNNPHKVTKKCEKELIKPKQLPTLLCWTFCG